MASVNKVILLDNLGKDPETRSMQDGSRIVSFTLATSESWTDRATGQRKERTEWSRVVVMGNDHLTKIASERLHKGSRVYIEGKLQTRKWTAQDGTDRYVTEILIGRYNAVLSLMDRAEAASGAHDADDEPRQDSRDETPRQRPPADGAGTAHRGASARQNHTFGDTRGRLDDDEIPF